MRFVFMLLGVLVWNLTLRIFDKEVESKLRQMLIMPPKYLPWRLAWEYVVCLVT